MANEQQWLAFRLDEQTYGVEIASVREIVRTPQITPIPQSPEYVSGVMNLRGRIVPVIDLRRKLGGEISTSAKAESLPCSSRVPGPEHGTRDTEHDLTPDSRKSRVLVMTNEGKLTGLLVDQASEVLKIASPDIEPSPKLFGDEVESYVTGVAKHRGNLVVLLDAATLLRTSTQEAALA